LKTRFKPRVFTGMILRASGTVRVNDCWLIKLP
jgi:hypothetical protein